MPLRNLKTPVLTTSSFGFKPSVIATRSPRASPNLTNCCRIVSVSFPVFSSFFFSITKTELPNGAYEIAEPGTTSVLCFSEHPRPQNVIRILHRRLERYVPCHRVNH